MKITVITVGKIKEKYLKDAIDEYSKRLNKYCRLEMIEVADEKTPDQASGVVEDNIRAKEGERILKYIKEDAYVITLEIQGNMLTSEDKPYHIYHRRIHWTGHRSSETFRLRAQLFKDDFPASADAGHPAGANIPELSDHTGGAIS